MQLAEPIQKSDLLTPEPYNEKKEIFRDAAIDVPAGHSVAVIGTSGAGKTTLLDLLLGLLEPRTGSIRYDDNDVVSRTDGGGSYWAQIGDIISYIPQTVYLNGETVENNVVLFEEEDKIDREKVIDCLKCAQVWDDVEQMPNGLHTLIGENGTKISGGSGYGDGEGGHRFHPAAERQQNNAHGNASHQPGE